MLLRELAQIIEDFADLRLQESYDNAGLIIGNKEQEIEKVLICLDVTDEVVDEAIDLNCDMIISHHPLIFLPLKKISSKSLVYKAIQNNIAVYAAHTNLDSATFGVSWILAKNLGLNELRPLSEKNDFPNQGLGAIGKFDEAISEEEFLLKVKTVCKCKQLRYSKSSAKKIKTVALCGGAGGNMINDAISQNADAFLTADLSYHHFDSTEKNILIVDAGHYETEQYAIDILYDLLKNKVQQTEIIKTTINTNFVKYF
jgi:dinuclear metal center YbgI/SA1388 family protein